MFQEAEYIQIIKRAIAFAELDWTDVQTSKCIFIKASSGRHLWAISIVFNSVGTLLTNTCKTCTVLGSEICYVEPDK